jgi:hypothetical protein
MYYMIRIAYLVDVVTIQKKSWFQPLQRQIAPLTSNNNAIQREILLCRASMVHRVKYRA